MGDAKRTSAQSWRVWLALGERWEIRSMLLGWPVTSADRKARNRAIESVDDEGFEQPYGLDEKQKAEWLDALNARLRDEAREAVAVTSENAAMILDVIDAILDDDRGDEKAEKAAKTSKPKGGDPRMPWRLRHATAALEAVRRGESVTGVAEPAVPGNGAAEAAVE